jgi:hypothetical protein
MTNAEVKQFINREVKGLWPYWEPTEAEACLWMKKLRRYPYDAARAALQEVCCEQTSNYRRPILVHFLAKARRLAAPACGGEAAHDPDTNVFIRCIEPPAGHANRRGVERPVYVLPRSQQHDPDYVRACAETMRRQSERLYGGHWITLIKKPPSPTDPTCPQTGNPIRRKSAESVVSTTTAYPQHNERAPPS